MKRNPVIGYIAWKSRTEVYCEDRSCLVTGSEQKMRALLTIRGRRPEEWAIRKARFDDIVGGLGLGGEYGFDEEAYSRFAPVAAEIGIPRQEFDFTASEPGRVKFLNLKTK
jgi:hypothetical protein